jgi:hypothetical protein
MIKLIKKIHKKIIFYIYNKIPKQKEISLFDGDHALFCDHISHARVYVEYGCGASTLWVAKNSNCSIWSVDTSAEWIAKVRLEAGKRNSFIHLHHADLGPVGSWGRPLSYEKIDNFIDYTDWVWQQDISPDVILIDGRFRVACFLTTLCKAKPGAHILFDDYVDRPYYHFVERFISPISFCGRQALFIVPKEHVLNIVDIKSSIDMFRNVFD